MLTLHRYVGLTHSTESMLLPVIAFFVFLKNRNTSEAINRNRHRLLGFGYAEVSEMQLTICASLRMSLNVIPPSTR